MDDVGTKVSIEYFPHVCGLMALDLLKDAGIVGVSTYCGLLVDWAKLMRRIFHTLVD